MTELELAINSLKAAISGGNVLLEKLEAEQKDLEESPRHRWEHGDVFMNTSNCEMIFICCGGQDDKVFCLGQCTGHDDAAAWLADGRFLFNIKEKL